LDYQLGRRGSALLGILALSVPLALPASAADPVTVSVNGQTVPLSPPPIERAGRVFVPLRGIFERLGATVVYQGGTINATGNNRSIGLHIGSTSASVNGQQQGLDVAPFIIGASTYVPLRFVSQALGAQVNFDGAHNIVAISTNGAAAAPVANNPPPAAAPTTASASTIRLGQISPARDAAVSASRPSIVANFTDGKADPNTLRVTLDDFDITNRTTPSPTGIIYAPPSPLQATRHVVKITGKDMQARPFDLRWAFTSGQSQVQNSISALAPNDGDQVPANFTVSGTTLPNATVHIAVGAQEQSAQSAIGRILGIGGGQSTFNYDIIADGSGHFSQQVNLNAPSGTSVALVATSTDAVTKTSSPKVQRQFTVR